MVIKRDKDIYLDAQIKMDKVLGYVKRTIEPISLKCAISEFKISETELVTPAIVDTEPLPTKRRQTVMAVFIVVIFINTLLSFILEGRKKQ